jgi:arsenite-transporting ATPase
MAADQSLHTLSHPSLKLVFTGGKGGVGKTTTASALGLRLAEEGYRTLITSTDPAHSLSDSFGLSSPAGHYVQPFPSVEGLFLQEMDAEQALEDFKEQHAGEIHALIQDATYLDQEDAGQLLNLAIPGLDEVMAFIQITEWVESEEFQKVVVDTAPTGHALRLLHFPELLDDWIKVMAALRYKYHRVLRALGGGTTAGDTDDWLLTLKRKVKRVRRLLTSPEVSEFVVVARPERMVLAETQRLIRQLSGYGIGLRHLIVNGLFPEGEGGFCARVRQRQDEEIARFQEAFPGLELHMLPFEETEIRGLQPLQAVSQRMFVSSS